MSELDKRNQVYSIFGKFIKEYFFSQEKVGCAVFPMVDSSLIKFFCYKECMTFNTFFQSIQRKSLWDIHWESSDLEMLGLIGIQLYAASQMENSDGLTSGNYRDRICSNEILNIDVGDWRKWTESNQDRLWAKYYSWCTVHGFILLNKCNCFKGKRDRYVQYPKVHSSLILNREDLKRIANLFVQKRISPSEDLSEKEFWQIIGIYHYENFYTNRTKRILDKNRTFANKQIFLFYLAWNGEYIEPFSNKTKSNDKKYQMFLYYDKVNWSLDVYNSDDRLIETNILLERLSYENDIRPYHTQKHSDYILFKPCDEYDNYWEECRSLLNKDEVGLILLNRRSYFNQFRSRDIISQFKNYFLIKINYHNYPRFYSDERPYCLSGGLKILPNTYILGAPPLLTFHNEMPFWIDGVKQEEQKGVVTLNLNEGKHVISIKGYKPIIIQIKSVSPTVHYWGENRKWLLKRSSRYSLWNSDCENGYVVGLDFEHLSNDDTNIEGGAVLSQWCRNILFKKSSNLLNFKQEKYDI